MEKKKRSNQDLLKEMRDIAKTHEEMKAVVEGMLKEIEVLEVKHQILTETLRDNQSK